MLFVDRKALNTEQILNNEIIMGESKDVDSFKYSELLVRT